MEIEGPVKEIKRVEKLLGAEKILAVMETYPSLTREFGVERRGVIEARFPRAGRRPAKVKTGSRQRAGIRRSKKPPCLSKPALVKGLTAKQK